MLTALPQSSDRIVNGTQTGVRKGEVRSAGAASKVGESPGGVIRRGPGTGDRWRTAMTAATNDLLNGAVGALSPELVLVDPDLAACARPLLPRPADLLDRSAQSAPPTRPVFPVPFQDNGRFSFESGATAAEARQRLLDAVDPEITSVPGRPGKPVRRLGTLIPTGSAAASVALLLLQLYTGQGTLA